MTTAFVTLAANNTENEAISQYETIDIKQVSLQPGLHEEYGQYSFKKGDLISADIRWNEPSNVYFAIGTEFGHFRGLESSGRNSTFLNTAIEVKEDGEYYIFLGIQGTENKNADEIMGEIIYPASSSHQ